MIRAAVAQGWGAAAMEACRRPFPDCTRCRRPESSEMRVAWGCDADSPRIVWESTCARCSGTDSECSRCNGTNVVEHRRCPNSMLQSLDAQQQVQLDLLLRAYAHYDRRNVLPSQGAWLDQSRSFLACVDLLDAERGYWQEHVRRHHEKEMERQRLSSMQQRRR